MWCLDYWHSDGCWSYHQCWMMRMKWRIFWMAWNTGSHLSDSWNLCCIYRKEMKHKNILVQQIFQHVNHSPSYGIQMFISNYTIFLIIPSRYLPRLLYSQRQTTAKWQNIVLSVLYRTAGSGFRLWIYILGNL